MTRADPSPPAAATPWRGFAGTLVGATLAALLGIVGAAYLVDPYDTGRSTLFERQGVRPQGPRTAAASRGRDLAFNAAIIGNSHVQLLSPERLDAATGLAFVQLAVPATGPKEQLVLLDWFLRHRRDAARAVVLGIDSAWCTGDPTLRNEKPFPFWLFAEDALTYARGLIRYDMLEELPRRIGFVLARAPERARPDGYWDYEADYLRLGYDRRPEVRRRLETAPGDDAPNGTGRFPAAEALREAAARLPADTALILVFPPAYIVFQPRPGTPRAAEDAACKARFRALAEAHPRLAVVDWRTDRPANRDPSLFFDQTHYRQPIAREVEKDVAESLSGLR